MESMLERILLFFLSYEKGDEGQEEEKHERHADDVVMADLSFGRRFHGSGALHVSVFIEISDH